LTLILSLDFALLVYLPFLFAAIFFGFMTLTDNVKRRNFVLLSLVIAIGTICTSFFDQLEVLRDLDRFMRTVFGIDTDFSMGVFSWTYNSYGYDQTLPLDWVVGEMFGNILMFLGITFLYKHLNGEQKWGFFLVQLGRRINQQKMAAYVFAFYGGLVFLSFGIFGYVFNFLRYTWRSSYGSNSGVEDYIFAFLIIISGIIMLTFMIGLYRKILIEYYLDHGKPISWNFYFGQVPVIGFFVWIYNLINFKPADSYDLDRMRKESVKDTGLKLLLIIFACVLFLLATGLTGYSRGEVQAVGLVVLFVGLAIYALYLYNENGVYIMLGLQLLGFLIILVAELLGFDIPTGALSKGMFWSMTQALLLYPAFHLKMFTVTIPPSTEEIENDEFNTGSQELNDF
jgi:hypothetical protein